MSPAQPIQRSEAVKTEALFRTHAHFVARMLGRLGVTSDELDDAVQEVFLVIAEKLKEFRGDAKLTTWLFRIATHVALNWIRDGRNEKSHTSLDKETTEGASRQVPDWHRTVEQELLYEAKLGEVRQAIRSLPAKQRAAVMMHKYEEMEYAQIAGAIGCSESAVKSLLFRAYEALRVRLAHML